METRVRTISCTAITTRNTTQSMHYNVHYDNMFQWPHPQRKRGAGYMRLIFHVVDQSEREDKGKIL